MARNPPRTRAIRSPINNAASVIEHYNKYAKDFLKAPGAVGNAEQANINIPKNKYFYINRTSADAHAQQQNLGLYAQKGEVGSVVHELGKNGYAVLTIPTSGEPELNQVKPRNENLPDSHNATNQAWANIWKAIGAGYTPFIDENRFDQQRLFGDENLANWNTEQYHHMNNYIKLREQHDLTPNSEVAAKAKLQQQMDAMINVLPPKSKSAFEVGKNRSPEDNWFNPTPQAAPVGGLVASPAVQAPQATPQAPPTLKEATKKYCQEKGYAMTPPTANSTEFKVGDNITFKSGGKAHLDISRCGSDDAAMKQEVEKFVELLARENNYTPPDKINPPAKISLNGGGDEQSQKALAHARSILSRYGLEDTNAPKATQAQQQQAAAPEAPAAPAPAATIPTLGSRDG